MKSFIYSLLAVLLSIAALNVSAAKHRYDIVISGGRVMDPETGYDAIANVGIRGDRITRITSKPLKGKRRIDARGLVVAPGFIDTHFHWQRPMGYKLGLRDGVTTVMDLEYGTLGTAIDDWYARRAGTTQVNYATSSSHEAARSLVLDEQRGVQGDAPDGGAARTPNTRWASATASPIEQQEILRIIEVGLRAGSLGVGSTLGYMREGVSVSAFFEIQRLAARYGRQVSVHLRHTPGAPDDEILGAQEILANAAALGAPACINHFNNRGWETVHALLTGMQAQGHNVWGEIYPYAAGSTTINAAFFQPKVWIEQLGHRYEETLMDPQTNTFYTQETYEAALADDPARIVLVFKMPESVVPDWLRLPGIALASDGMPILGEFAWDTPFDALPNMHPRGAGSRGKALRLGRKHGIPLMQTLAQLSYTSAKHLGSMGLRSMQDRGRLQEGKIADITLFDPATVTDRATYKAGTKPTEGIRYVLVNGVPVVDEGAVRKDVYPGQAIRW